MENKLLIEIWSDIACPYCYLGLAKLEKAIDSLGYKDDIEIKWHSYELNPSLPKGHSGKGFFDYIAGIHGESIADAKKGFEPLLKMTKEAGLDYNLEKIVVTNSSDALRLVKLAAKYDKATEMEVLLFKAYFTEGRCVSDPSILIDLGKKVGISESEIKNMLDSDLFLSDIKEDIKYSEETLNLEYIPFYRINNSITIQGAIEDADYIKALQTAYKEWKSGEATDDTAFKGQSCSIDGVCS